MIREVTGSHACTCSGPHAAGTQPGQMTLPNNTRGVKVIQIYIYRPTFTTTKTETRDICLHSSVTITTRVQNNASACMKKKRSKEHLFIFEPAKTRKGDRIHLNKKKNHSLCTGTREGARARSCLCTPSVIPTR